MMNAFRRLCEKILRIPPEPEAPPGDEATARIFRAAPAYFRLLMIMWVISNLFIFLFFIASIGTGLVAAIVTARHQRGAEVVAAIFGLVLFFIVALLVFQAVFRLAVMRLEYEKRWYVVTDRSLRVREGVVIVREMTVSFANIQDVAVTQGPIERLLGLSNVRVTTAGGGGHTQNKQAGPNLHQAWFRGIDNAEEVKNLILERLRALKDSGLGHREETVATATSAPAGTAFRDALSAVLDEARALRQSACRPVRQDS
jgi:membrane protein YdbS with pleckstrin-like domain